MWSPGVQVQATTLSLVPGDKISCVCVREGSKAMCRPLNANTCMSLVLMLMCIGLGCKL
jgi:hypothetical protein